MFGKALIPNHRKIPIFDFVAPCTLEEEFPPSSYLRKAATLADKGMLILFYLLVDSHCWFGGVDTNVAASRTVPREVL